MKKCKGYKYGCDSSSQNILEKLLQFLIYLFLKENSWLLLKKKWEVDYLKTMDGKNNK